MNSGCSAIEFDGVALGRRALPSNRATNSPGRAPSSPANRCGGRRPPFRSWATLAGIRRPFCLSGTSLPRRQPPSAVITSLRLGVIVAVRDRVGTKAAEDDRMRRADPRTGQHGDDQFGNHRHVDGDAVARFDAQLLQDIGEAADFAVQILIAQARGVSPGSPSQMMAALFFRQSVRCRSRQL